MRNETRNESIEWCWSNLSTRHKVDSGSWGRSLDPSRSWIWRYVDTFISDGSFNNPFSYGTDRSISDRSRPVLSKRQNDQRSGSPSHAVGPGAFDENGPGLGSLLYSTAKLVLRAVKGSTDAFPPLKSVAGCLCFILDSYEVRPSPINYPIQGSYSCPRKRLHFKR